MKKIIVLLAIAFFMTTGVAFAGHNEGCPPNNPNCNQPGDGDEGGSGDIKNTNTNTNFNTAFGGKGGNGGKGGEGGDASANSSNKNYNTNLNSNMQGQDQVQGQVQGQLQGQDQDQLQSQSASSNSDSVASANNAGNKQTTDIVIQDNSVVNHAKIPVQYDHITPDIGKTNSDMIDHNGVMNLKAMGSIDAHISAITRVHADKLSKGASDVEVVKSIMFENDFRTTMISKGAVGQFMGFIYVIPDGSDVTMAGIEGKAYLAAMDAGATHYTMEHSSGMYVEGSKAGIDFGGSASVAIAADGSAVIAPGATFGYSKAWSSNEIRPGVIITLYFDETLKITPAK